MHTFRKRSSIRTRLQQYVPGSLCIVFMAVLATAPGCKGRSDRAETDNIPIVDTHIHLYDLERLPGIPWPEKNDTVLYRSVHAEEFNTVMAENRLAGAIVVEASPRVSDNDWVLYHTEKYKDRYVGLVGALDFDKGTFKDDLQRLCQNERFVGLRIGTQYLDQPADRNYMKNPLVHANLQHLSDSGKTLDIVLIKVDIDEALFIAKNYPKLKIVVNNIDQVIIESQVQNTGPSAKIAEIASYPNVYCKVTSLVHKCTVTPAAQHLPYYKSELARVVELFGEDRLIYGSNWPCIIKDGPFSNQFNEINDYFAPRGRAFLEKLYYKNAEKAYGFKLKK